MSDYITSPDAAKVAGIPAESIRELCRIGILRHRLIAGHFFPLREDVEHYVQLMAEAENDETQPVDYEQRTAQQKYLLQQFFWATVTRYYKGREERYPPREWDIAYQILAGRRLKDIGKDMNLSEGRVREIWEKVLRKWANYGSDLRQKELEVIRLSERVHELENMLYGNTYPDLLQTRLGDQDFSVRALNSLKAAEIETVADLVRLKREDLLKINNFSKRSIVELEAWLEQHELSLGMDV